MGEGWGSTHCLIFEKNSVVFRSKISILQVSTTSGDIGERLEQLFDQGRTNADDNQEKGAKMKRIIALAIIIAGAAVGSVTRASAQEPEVVAKVPFDFVVENQTLPAGKYRIESHGDSLMIESLDGNGAVFAIAFQGETTRDGHSALYFDVLGGDHFLRRVASPIARTSMEFPVCKIEKKAEVLRASRDKTEVINASARGGR